MLRCVVTGCTVEFEQDVRCPIPLCQHHWGKISRSQRAQYWRCHGRLECARDDMEQCLADICETARRNFML